MDENTKLPPMAEALMHNQAETRKWVLVIASVLGLLVFALVVAVWVGVGTIGKITQPQITVDQAVATGHAIVVEYDDGAKGIKWLPGPSAYAREIEEKALHIEHMRIDALTNEEIVNNARSALREAVQAQADLEVTVSELRSALATENKEAIKARAQLNLLRTAIGDTAKKIKYEDLPKNARNIDLLEELEDAATEETPPEAEKKSKWNPKSWFSKDKK